MRRTTIPARLRPVLRPPVLGVLAVLLVVGGLYWLMLHGHLDLVAWLLLALVIALVAGGVREWRREHRRTAALMVAGALVTVAAVGGYGWNLNAKLGDIDRADDTVLSEGERPPRRPTEALNILIMGADDPTPKIAKPSIEEMLDVGEWKAGAYRSDTIMVMHVPADRKSAYLVSVPRDSYVPVFDPQGGEHASDKINAAFSRYGPFGTWRTVENLSGLHLDHMAIIDYEGFRDLTSAIGGVDVYVPETVEDPKLHITWEQGWHRVEGDLALKYVRQRYNLAGGDFDRIARQQNFLRAVMNQVLADETIGNPRTFTATLAAITHSLTIDQSWGNGQIRGLALGLRGLDSKRVRFATLPLDRYERDPELGYVNIIDQERAQEMWTALTAGRLAGYLKKHPDDELKPPKKIS